ncbi:MAG: IclR family transcriptional regulator [Lachnospiraceae bacterium]|nr:IclR family transcriptional regulator [Lachnospiraceae bacterium]
MPTDNKLEPIQAVERAMMILESISHKGSMGLNELHNELKLNKASLLRLAYTLTECGYLDKNPSTGIYSLTLKPYEIGLNAVQNLDKISLISSTLADLSRETGRIAQFSVEDKNKVLCLQSIGQREPSFSVYTNVGRRSPLYCTSAGKAILSTYSNSDILERWDSLDVMQLTEYTLTDSTKFLQDISLTRQRGYALDIQENEYNVYCVGAVLMTHMNTVMGAISISGNTLTKEEEHEISTLLLEASQRLSTIFGFVTAK